jgi:hypothetical protein
VPELGAIVIDFLVAHAVNILHVLPPLISLALAVELLKEALLPQVFDQDIFALDVGTLVVHGTVSAIGEALLALEFSVAAGASPSHYAWCELCLRP